MVAIGMMLVWAGYSLGLEGWALWRDYNLTLGQLMSPMHPYDGPWPPQPISPGVIWPGAQAVPSATGSTGQAAGAAGTFAGQYLQAQAGSTQGG